MQQILKGIQYLHKNKIIHWDIKGANILIDKSGTVKLADFGLARVIYPEIRNINYTIKVVTLWYRAPELLLASKNYNEKVDIWSLGCFFTELFLGKNVKVLVGYNHRLRRELRLQQTAGGAGFSFGLFLKIKMFDITYARSTFHTAGGSNHLTLTTNFKKFKKTKL